MDDYENAESELKQAIDGDNTEALVLLGMVYMDKGDSANAKAMFQQYVSQAENGAKGFNGLALCDIEDGDYDSALSDIESGIHVAGAEDMQSLLFNEIVVYEKKLDFQTALQKAQEYLELYPEDKLLRRNLHFLKRVCNIHLTEENLWKNLESLKNGWFLWECRRMIMIMWKNPWMN